MIGLSLFSIAGGSLGCISLLGLWFVTKDSSSAPRRPAGNYGLPSDGLDTDEDISDDESASAPEMPSEMQGEKLQIMIRSWSGGSCLVRNWFCLSSNIVRCAGAAVDPSGTSNQYKDARSNKIADSSSQSSFLSDDSTRSGFGSQQPHVEFQHTQRGHKKIM